MRSSRFLARMFHEFESFICKAFRGAVVLMLTQAPDNEANERLGLACRVTFMLLCQNITLFKVLPAKYNSNQFTAMNIIMKMKYIKIFM